MIRVQHAVRPHLFSLWSLLIILLMPLPASAVEPSEMLSDPVLEARARELSKGLRCLVCRNQNIDDSNSGIARDLRVLLRERLSAGDNDDQAVQYLVDRFGAYILLRPPFQLTTYLLWIGPILILLAAIFGFRSLWRNPGSGTEIDEDFSTEDRKLIAKILNQKD